MENSGLDTNEIVTARSLLQTEYERVGIVWNDGWELEFSNQHYGVPDNSGHAEHLTNYCAQAREYLDDELVDLFEANLSWQQLRRSGVDSLI